MITIKTTLTKDQSSFQKRQILKLALENGNSMEDLVRETGLDWGTLEKLLERPKPSRTEIGLQQVLCPICKSRVLTPPIAVHKDQLSSDIYQKYTFCCSCLKPLLIYFNNSTSLGVVAVPEVKELDDAKIKGIHTGVAFTTGVYARRTPYVSPDRLTSWEVRVGIALFGSVNFRSMIGACPFDPNFMDNYCHGEGATIDEALIELNAEIQKMTNILWT